MKIDSDETDKVINALYRSLICFQVTLLGEYLSTLFGGKKKYQPLLLDEKVVDY